MHCTNCGAYMPEGTKFCTNCGAPMNGSVTVPLDDVTKVPYVQYSSQAFQTTQAAQAFQTTQTAQPFQTTQAAQPCQQQPYQQQPYQAPSDPYARESPNSMTTRRGFVVGGIAAAAVVGIGAVLYASGLMNPGSASNDGVASGSQDAAGTADDVTIASDGTVSSSRYGFSLKPPASFDSHTTDDSGNMVLVDSKSDTTIALMADDNPDNQTLDEAYNAAVATVGEEPYYTTDDNWYVVSDYENNHTYVRYLMKYVVPGRTATMLIRYPASQEGYGDQIVEEVQPTFLLS